MRTVTINYKELTDSLAKLEEDYPSRMHGDIDLLSANIKYHFTQFLSNDLLSVELDETTVSAKIDGKPIMGDVYAIYDHSKNPTSSEIMYEQIMGSMKSAKQLGFYERVFHVRETIEKVDESILNSKQNRGDSYLDELAFAVCVNGESIVKYKKIVEKQFGIDTYANMEQFVQTLQQQVERLQFTNTSLLSLKYIGKNAGMSEEAIDKIIDHFNIKVKREQLIREEDEYWNNCDHNDKHALLDYVRKYPKGKYVGRAKSLVAELEKKEKDAIEESRAFNQCRTQSDYMNYLNKYPIGAYSAKAKAIVEEFELKEIEEDQVYNICKDKSDYLAYLRKYPNGKYVKEAHAKINVLECEEKRKREETAFWNQCSQNSIPQLQEYLRKYPNGMYTTRAKSLIADLERIEKETIEENSNVKTLFGGVLGIVLLAIVLFFMWKPDRSATIPDINEAVESDSTVNGRCDTNITIQPTTKQNDKEAVNFASEKSEKDDKQKNSKPYEKDDKRMDLVKDEQKPSKPKEKDKILDVVEQMPSFPGGDAELMRFLSTRIKYPVEAEENGIQGRVIATFVVERDGSISDVKVVKSVDPSLDKEAIRVLKSMPKWIPGKQNGSAVRVKYTMPITFNL